ncbi:MAG: hypothetical protein ACJ8AI_27540 [Rhodopila sp.]
MRGFLRVEIDRRLSRAEIKDICRTTGIPLPNVVVGHADASGALLNPHLLWLLEHSVSFTDQGLRRFKSLFSMVLRGLTVALIPYGADPGGYSNAMRVKNPLSPLWHREVLGERPYSLNTLKVFVDLTAKLSGADATGPVPQDHPDADVAAASNALFNRLRAWAYERVVAARDEQGLDLEAWTDMVAAEARALAPWPRRGSSLRPGDEGAHRGDPLMLLARRVAEWTWKNYRVKATRLSAAEVAARQAEAGRASSAARASRSRDLVLQAVRAMTAVGETPKPMTVFAWIRANGHSLSERTVQRHWPMVSASAAAPSNCYDGAADFAEILPDLGTEDGGRSEEGQKSLVSFKHQSMGEDVDVSALGLDLRLGSDLYNEGSFNYRGERLSRPETAMAAAGPCLPQEAAASMDPAVPDAVQVASRVTLQLACRSGAPCRTVAG